MDFRDVDPLKVDPAAKAPSFQSTIIIRDGANRSPQLMRALRAETPPNGARTEQPDETIHLPLQGHQ
jgi:hypothetical protein